MVTKRHLKLLAGLSLVVLLALTLCSGFALNCHSSLPHLLWALAFGFGLGAHLFCSKAWLKKARSARRIRCQYCERVLLGVIIATTLSGIGLASFHGPTLRYLHGGLSAALMLTLLVHLAMNRRVIIRMVAKAH